MIQQIISIAGNAGATKSHSCSDIAQGLTDVTGLSLSKDDGKLAHAVLITCENNAMRFAMEGTTATTSVGHVLHADQSIIISGSRNLRTLSFINAVALSAAVIQITPYFADGVVP